MNMTLKYIKLIFQEKISLMIKKGNKKTTKMYFACEIRYWIEIAKARYTSMLI